VESHPSALLRAGSAKYAKDGAPLVRRGLWGRSSCAARGLGVYSPELAYQENNQEE
jgi:hypothetical protein